MEKYFHVEKLSKKDHLGNEFKNPGEVVKLRNPFAVFSTVGEKQF